MLQTFKMLRPFCSVVRSLRKNRGLARKTFSTVRLTNLLWCLLLTIQIESVQFYPDPGGYRSRAEWFVSVFDLARSDIMQTGDKYAYDIYSRLLKERIIFLNGAVRVVSSARTRY